MANFLLEFLPDVAAQPVAASNPQPMRALARMGRRVHQITREFADILKYRAVAVDDIVPEMLRRKLVADQHRTAAHQSRACGDDPADAVIHRQAIIDAITRAGVHQAGKP